MNKEQKGYILVLGFIFSIVISSFILDYIFRNFSEISVENSIFWGFWGAMISASPFFIRTKRQRKTLEKEFFKNKKLIFISSILTSIAAFFWILALDLSSSGIVALLFQTEVIFAFLLGIFVLKEKINFLEILGFMIAIVGIILIANLKGEVTNAVVTAVLFSAFLYALQSFFIKKLGKNLNSSVFAFQRIIFTTLILSFVFLVQNKINLIPLNIFLMLTLSEILGFFIGRIFYVEAHKYLPISKLNTFLFLQPIIMLMGAYFIFGDGLSSQKIIGTFCIVSGLIFFIKSRDKLKSS